MTWDVEVPGNSSETNTMSRLWLKSLMERIPKGKKIKVEEGEMSRGVGPQSELRKKPQQGWVCLQQKAGAPD